MTPRPNKYAGPCRRCQGIVAALAGYIEPVGGKWAAVHRHCADGSTTAPTASLRTVAVPTVFDGRILIDFSDQGWVTFDTARLNADQFLAARQAMHGTDKHGTALPRARIEIAVFILDRLHTIAAPCGITIDMSPRLLATIQAFRSGQAIQRTAASERAREINERLRAIGRALFAFQEYGVEWLGPTDGAILADDMGLGKTIQALAAAPVGQPILVVSPSVAKGVWVREASSWRPDLRPIVLSGRRSFRWPKRGEMVIINYDVLSVERSKCETCDGAGEYERVNKTTKIAKTMQCSCLPIDAAPQGCVIIADEAHALKNAKAGRTVAFRGLVEHVRKVAGKVWLVTATPMLNRPAELWSLLCLISKAKQCFGTWDSFVTTFGGVKDRWNVIRWGVRPVNTELIADRLRDVMLRRMKTEVLKDLPAKTIDIVDVSLDASSIKDLNSIRAELAAAGIDLDLAMAAAKGNTSTEIAALARARAILAMAKLPAVLEKIDEIEESGEPMVVLSAHRGPIDIIAKRPGWATITGDTPTAERTRIEEAFQRGEYKGIAGTIKAMGVAITLTRASFALFIDPDWTPSWNEQAEDRIYRIGTLRAVLIWYMRADHPIDEAVFDCLGIKRELIARSVNAARVDEKGQAYANA